MATKLAHGKVIISAAVHETQRAALLELARAGDRTLSAEIRRALMQYLNRTEKPA